MANGAQDQAQFDGQNPVAGYTLFHGKDGNSYYLKGEGLSDSVIASKVAAIRGTSTGQNSPLPAGSYQMRAGGPVVQPGMGEQTDASGIKQIVPIPGEDFADTMRRGIEAGKSVTPAQIQQENARNIRNAPLALAAGPAMAAAQLAIPVAAGAALAPTTGTATVGTGILDAAGEEITKDIVTQGPSLARAGINIALNAIKSHPIISAYVGTHLANALGIPLPKVLKAMAGIREVAE